jgi:antitoxin (DNA-binding transcriptional repressor) of toxin-antitoxin stability system
LVRRPDATSNDAFGRTAMRHFAATTQRMSGSRLTFQPDWACANNMQTVNIHKATTHRSRLLEAVERGEEITIARAGQPIATLTAYKPRRNTIAPADHERKACAVRDYGAGGLTRLDPLISRTKNNCPSAPSP